MKPNGRSDYFGSKVKDWNGGGKMSRASASIRPGISSYRNEKPLVWKSSDGQIHVETLITSHADDAAPIANTRFQGGRVGLLTAIGLASIMGATAASAQDGGVQLPTIDVSGDQGSGYQATQQSITRLPTPLRDTPQTVNVVTQQVIQDQRANTMEEALRNVPGITFSAGEGGQQGDSPFINGQSARNDIFRDGIRDPGWYTRDLFPVERVEVYKGPAAFAFGRGATGGAINNVSKIATGASFAETTVTGSTAGGVRVDGDASGKVGNIAGRVVVMGQDLDTADRDNIWTKRWGIAPSFVMDITDSTKATLAYIYQGEESVPDYGVPWRPAPTTNAATGARTGGYNGDGSAVTPVQVPHSNWYGFTTDPLKDLVQTNTHIVTGKLEHRFNEAFTLTNTTRYIAVDRMARPTAPRTLNTATGSSTIPAGYPEDQMTIGRQHFETDTDNTMLVNQTDLLAKFHTFGLKHTVSAGMELSRETRWQQRANLCNPTGAGACRTSLWTPDPSAPNGVFTGYGVPNETTQDTVALYASDQIKLNKYFDLLGALRYDSFKTDYESGATQLSRTDNLLSWRFGGVYHPIPNASIYVTYGNSYNPSAEFGTLSTSGTNSVLLDPEKTVLMEAGVKVDVLNERLSLTGSVFRADKTNMRVPVDPLSNTVYALDGKARIDGVELGITGKVTDKWNVLVGYSHLNSEILETTQLDRLGNEVPNTPPNNFTFWSTYDVTTEWTVGGGAFYQDRTYANDTNTLYVPSYWRFDVMTSYKITPKMILQLNIYNLTDEYYYAQYYGGHAVPAAGRYAALSLRTRW
jgi:catecholate siderophore receptor